MTVRGYRSKMAQYHITQLLEALKLVDDLGNLTIRANLQELDARLDEIIGEEGGK